jgi:hypothetical protein
MVIKIKFSTLPILVIFLAVFAIGVVAVSKKSGWISIPWGANLIQPVSASEIYPLFFCPCCGQPLDKNNICCDQARERIDYIDSLTGSGNSKDEIILAYAKKYGLNSFVDENKAKEIREELLASAPEERPTISLSPASFDFGDVSQKEGIVFTYFNLKNEGKKDLIVNRLDTSCGCTSAAIVFNGQEGPRFAMPGHGIENPAGWEIVIPPGESARLKVYYDPSVHLDFRGFGIREISVYSNDPIDFEKKVQIELTQVD